MQASHYCEHFQNLKITKNIDLNRQFACKVCHIGKNYLWLCLSKNCGELLCDRNKKQHIKLHLEQSKNKKSFHSIFINVFTAQIVCVHCGIQIYDLDIIKNNDKCSNIQDPFPIRLKILPSLSQFNQQKNKMLGQLENSEGHKKTNRELTGFFSDKNNFAINSALQFLMQFQLFRQIVLNCKPLNKQLQHLQKILKQAEEANFRALYTDQLFNILINEKPELRGYRRKDPFEHIMHFMTKLHQSIKFYTVDSFEDEIDAWEYLGNQSTANKPNLNCPLFDNLSSTISLNYHCAKCKRQASIPFDLNFLKVSFPKKKRKAKQVQKQLVEHRFQSPMKKKRRNSLISFFLADQQCPFTLPELIIQFLKQPFYKDKFCLICKQPMIKIKNHFQSLSQYLIIQINRMGSDGNSIDLTKLQYSQQPIDLGIFTADKNSSCIYQLQTALCIQNPCSYPIITKNKHTRQTYIFKNELVGMLTGQQKSLNPYVLCYKKKRQLSQELKLKDCFHNICSNIQIKQQQQQSANDVNLPDFWLSQLKYNIEAPLKNQMVCKHKKLKPYIYSKMKQIQKVPKQVYQYLLEMFKGQKFLNIECKACLDEIQRIKQRKIIEKQKILEYQKLKTSLSVMISYNWIKKWMNFLYKKGDFAYFSKGYPMPGSIDNKSLLDGQKCKSNLHKNQDYKVVSIFVWKFLKQLYGGGPEIRYKWDKRQLNQFQEETIKQIKAVSKNLKQIYVINYVQSPKKSMIIQKTTSYVESVRGSEQGEDISLPQQIE